MKILPNGFDISDEDVKYLEDRLLDIEGWVVNAILGQINHAKGEFLKRGTELIKNDPSITMIPKDEAALSEIIFSHPEYKNRQIREKELLDRMNLVDSQS
jgi:hypothetical protein